ncbi:hypothetical protein C8J57DRAFT_1246885 [Mycena rebaudengoi]|nr:hypothetical protein C8J57DRAFT_1246885 [Mycena rebaudengoi]
MGRVLTSALKADGIKNSGVLMDWLTGNNIDEQLVTVAELEIENISSEEVRGRMKQRPDALQSGCNIAEMRSLDSDRLQQVETKKRCEVAEARVGVEGEDEGSDGGRTDDSVTEHTGRIAAAGQHIQLQMSQRRYTTLMKPKARSAPSCKYAGLIHPDPLLNTPKCQANPMDVTLKNCNGGKLGWNQATGLTNPSVIAYRVRKTIARPSVDPGEYTIHVVGYNVVRRYANIQGVGNVGEVQANS